jgi:Rab-GTPase-TBC domain
MSSSSTSKAPFLKVEGSDAFWSEEAHAPIFLRERGFLKGEAFRQHECVVSSWPHLVRRYVAKQTANDNNNNKGAYSPAPGAVAGGVGGSEKKSKEQSLSESVCAVLRRDVDRTFCSQVHRDHLLALLSRLVSGDSFDGEYQQCVAYIAGLLLLYFDDDTVVFVLESLNDCYFRGYYRGEAVGYAVDAYVLMELVKDADEPLWAHLSKHGMMLPEMYLQPYFLGLGINKCMPFEHVVPFLSHVFEHGFRYVVQFMLALLSAMRTDLLACTDQTALFATLRLSEADERAIGYLKAAFDTAHKHNVDSRKFDELRTHCYETYLRARLESAAESRAAAAAAATPNADSDSHSHSDSDDDEDDEYSCQSDDCENLGEWYRADGHVLLCSACRKLEPHKSLAFTEMDTVDDQESIFDAVRQHLETNRLADVLSQTKIE